MFTTTHYKVLTACLVVVAGLLQGVGYAQTATVLERLRLRPGVGDVGSVSRLCARDGAKRSTSECNGDGDMVALELAGLGSRGALIAHAREQTLEILEARKGCATWFEESDPEIEEVLRSLHYEIDGNGSASIVSMTDGSGNVLLKHPWGARASEGSGRNSFVEVNSNGPFFVREARVRPSDARSYRVAGEGIQAVMIGPYEGATAEAQIAILLHELGHIVGRLPSDEYARDERSSANTRQVLRHCEKEIQQAGRESRLKGREVAVDDGY